MFHRLRTDLVGSMRKAEAALLASNAGQFRRFSAGEVLTQADALDGRVHWLRTGWLRRVRSLPDGRAQTIILFLPGDLVGLKSVFMDRAPDEISSLSEGEVMSFFPGQLRQLIESDPNVALRVAWQLAEDERRLHDMVVSLGQGSAEERVALAIFDVLTRLRRSRALDAGVGGFELPMTQQQLAEYCGLTAIHINRVLRRLRLDEVMEMKRGRVRVFNEEALEARALPLSWREIREQAAE